jgi:hypothetical protein
MLMCLHLTPSHSLRCHLAKFYLLSHPFGIFQMPQQGILPSSQLMERDHFWIREGLGTIRRWDLATISRWDLVTISSWNLGTIN